MKFVAAVDGSDSSTRVLTFAARLAARSGGELSILAVRQRAIDEELCRFDKIENATMGDILEQETTAVPSATKARAETLEVKDISTGAGEGDPATVLLKGARGADLPVVGRRGRGRLGGSLLGRVSQKLAALSPVPLVIVP